MLNTQVQAGVFTTDRAIFRAFPQLRGSLAWADLIQAPTPVQRLEAPDDARTIWIKRDDLTSPLYGGNKPRTLEVLFGGALDLGARRVISTGAFGSNHAVATVIHAPRIGLKPGALLFPQPVSEDALQNFRIIGGRAQPLHLLPHWSFLPWAMWRMGAHAGKGGRDIYLMQPGGATPLGALGYVSAGLELAEQVERGELPVPERIVVAVGSTCTTAGLLLGLHLAADRAAAFRRRGRPRAPLLHAVRVTPWPVTSAWRIRRLAALTSRLLAERVGDADLAVSPRAFRGRLCVDGRELGGGYGHRTRAGALANEHPLGAQVALDAVYAEKSAAALLRLREQGSAGPILYWATKSSAPLPAVSARPDEPLSRRGEHWMHRAMGPLG